MHVSTIAGTAHFQSSNRDVNLRLLHVNFSAETLRGLARCWWNMLAVEPIQAGRSWGLLHGEHPMFDNTRVRIWAFTIPPANDLLHLRCRKGKGSS